MRRALAVLLLALVACDDASADTNAPPPGGPPPVADAPSAATASSIPLTAWVDKMVGNEVDFDTVDDKIGVVIDTDDDAAFDKFFK
ncbi:MAG: hypothetical protein ABW252_21330 [Polyangiales bacterium]